MKVAKIMKMNTKKYFITFLLIGIVASYTSAEDSMDSVAGEMRYTKLPEIPGMIIAYPDFFKVYDVDFSRSVLQSLRPEESAKVSEAKIIFVAVNKLEQRMQLTVTSREYRKDKNLKQIIGEIDADIAKRGVVAEITIDNIEKNCAVMEITSIPGQSEVVKTKCKLFLTAHRGNKSAVLYVISMASLFNDYYKYLPVIDAVIENSTFDHGGK